MGRQKRYPSSADRQAAYRQRLRTEAVIINRQYLEQWEDRIDRLLIALSHAADRGDPLARRMARGTREHRVETVIDWFASRGQKLETPLTTQAVAPVRSALGLNKVTAPTETSEHAGPSPAQPVQDGKKSQG